MYPTYLNDPATMALLDSVKPAAGRNRLDDGGGESSTDDARAMAAGTDQAAGAYDLQDTALKAASAVQTWVETDDLAEGEGSADRLLSLLVGIADDNQDGELDDNEQAVVQVAMNSAWDYLSGKGVSDSDLDALFNSDDPVVGNSAGDRVIEFVADVLPDGDEAATDDSSNFAFGNGAQEPVFDAVYKKRFAVRGGKKMMVRKRVSGHVRLSARQKVAIRKMHMKSHGSMAKAHRMKSMNKRRQMGL